MRAGIGTTSLGCLAAITATLALAHPAIAQDSGTVSDYRLPEPTQSGRPTVQGPVDPDNPLSGPARMPAPAVTSPPATAPTIEIPPPTLTAPAPTPRATRRPNPTPQASEPPAPPQVPATQDPAPVTAEEALPEPESSAVPSEPPFIVVPASSDDGPAWLLPGLLGAAGLGIAGFLFLRRRRSSAEIAAEPELARPIAPPPPAPRPVAAPPKADTPEPVRPVPVRPVPPAVPTPAPIAFTAEPLPLTTTLTVKALRLSLVYATLQYELDVMNAGPEPLPALQVRGDLASAHGAIPAREQLAPAPEAMEARHSLEPLAPGATAVLKGELRLPLQQIRPVTKGNAHFLVPLARFCILSPDGMAVRRVFTAGPQEPGSETIASIRLDAGPRNLRELASREIEAARSFALDPVGAQG